MKTCSEFEPLVCGSLDKWVCGVWFGCLRAYFLRLPFCRWASIRNPDKKRCAIVAPPNSFDTFEEWKITLPAMLELVQESGPEVSTALPTNTYLESP